MFVVVCANFATAPDMIGGCAHYDSAMQARCRLKSFDAGLSLVSACVLDIDCSSHIICRTVR